MPHTGKLVAALGLVAALAACSEPEPEVVTMAPTIDKMGNATCPAGTVLAIDGGTGAQVCAVTDTMSADDMS